MCGGGSSGSSTPQYQGPPGPGEGIGNVLIGQPDYQSAAQSLLSTGKTYGQMAALAAQNAPPPQAMAAPPAPQSAFNGGIGQYLAQQGSRPMGPSPALAAVQGLETQFDPRTAATEMLQGYEPVMEARPLSDYTPNAMANVNFDRRAEEEAARSIGGGGGGGSRSSGRTSSVSSRGGIGTDDGLRGGGSGGYTSVGDMFDGGGPGQSGSTFGGAVGGISNSVGLSPRRGTR